jgi:hypothetical protein
MFSGECLFCLLVMHVIMIPMPVLLQVATLCDIRFEELVQEPGGQELLALHEDELQPATGRVSSVQLRCSKLPHMMLI